MFFCWVTAVLCSFVVSVGCLVWIVLDYNGWCVVRYCFLGLRESVCLVGPWCVGWGCFMWYLFLGFLCCCGLFLRSRLFVYLYYGVCLHSIPIGLLWLVFLALAAICLVVGVCAWFCRVESWWCFVCLIVLVY